MRIWQASYGTEGEGMSADTVTVPREYLVKLTLEHDAQIERLRGQLACAEAFHKVAVAERDFERAKFAQSAEWRQCSLHGPGKANAWGCPDCACLQRDMIKSLKIAIHAALPFCSASGEAILQAALTANTLDATKPQRDR